MYIIHTSTLSKFQLQGHPPHSNTPQRHRPDFHLRIDRKAAATHHNDKTHAHKALSLFLQIISTKSFRQSDCYCYCFCFSVFSRDHTSHPANSDRSLLQPSLRIAITFSDLHSSALLSLVLRASYDFANTDSVSSRLNNRQSWLPRLMAEVSRWRTRASAWLWWACQPEVKATSHKRVTTNFRLACSPSSLLTLSIQLFPFYSGALSYLPPQSC